MTHGNLNNFNPNDDEDIKNIKNFEKIIKSSISKINLDLTDLIILTEAATGNWISTPLIASFANAKQVICISKDTKYGKSFDIQKNFKQIASYFDITDKIHVFDKLDSKLISKADIVTNSGHVRPIDRKFIDAMKKTAVITLMWEPWEFRSNELDLSYCWIKGISILGVNEDNNILNVMQYTGKNILKIFSNHNISINNKKIILVGENRSIFPMISFLIKNGAVIYIVSSTLKNQLQKLGMKIIGEKLSESKLSQFLKICDIILINSAPIHSDVIGGKTGLSISKLQSLNPNVIIVVYFGAVDYQQIKKHKINCYPNNEVKQGYMSWTLDFLGPQPTIELNCLGLKVGEILAKNRLSGLDPKNTEKKSLESGFCLDFSEEQKRKFGYYRPVGLSAIG